MLRKLWSAVPNGAYHQNSEAHARDFTMPGVELFFQVNTKSPNFFTKNANKPSKLKISKRIASGIDRNLGEKNFKTHVCARKTRNFAYRTYTRRTILSARIADAAYRGCPVAMTFDKQTKQRNSLLKENYEKQLKEHNTNSKSLRSTKTKQRLL